MARGDHRRSSERAWEPKVGEDCNHALSSGRALPGPRERGLSAMSLHPEPNSRPSSTWACDTIRIRAGAGTGKTTTAAMVISNLIAKHGIEPERFSGSHSPTRRPPSWPTGSDRHPRPAVDEGRQVEVHTYHGFAAQILAEFGALAGVDTGSRSSPPPSPASSSPRRSTAPLRWRSTSPIGRSSTRSAPSVTVSEIISSEPRDLLGARSDPTTTCG